MLVLNDELAITSTTSTFGTNIVIPNAATIGSVGDTDALSISAGGVVNVSATTDSFQVYQLVVYYSSWRFRCC